MENKKYSVEERVEGRRWIYTINEKNSKGETMTITISRRNTYSESRYSIAHVWKKYGHTKTVLREYWGIETYVTDASGLCWDKYNPQVMYDQKEKRPVINFDYMLDGCTPENLERLLNEAINRFRAA